MPPGSKPRCRAVRPAGLPGIRQTRLPRFSSLIFNGSSAAEEGGVEGSPPRCDLSRRDRRAACVYSSIIWHRGLRRRSQQVATRIGRRPAPPRQASSVATDPAHRGDARRWRPSIATRAAAHATLGAIAALSGTCRVSDDGPPAEQARPACWRNASSAARPGCGRLGTVQRAGGCVDGRIR